MRTEVTRGDKWVGLFVLAALMLGVGFVVAAHSDEFVAKQRYVMILDETYNLREGTNVLWRGMKIGEVERVAPDMERGLVEVVFRIDRPENYRRIKTDARVQIRGSLGPLRSAALELVDLGSDEAEMMGEMEQIAWIPPASDFETMGADAAEIVEQIKILSMRLNDEQRNGILELLGRNTSETVQHTVERIAHSVDEDMLPVTQSLRNMAHDLDTGRRTLAGILFDDKPLVEVMLGAEMQARVRDVAEGEAGMLEVVMGPQQWQERTDSMARIEEEVVGILKQAEHTVGRANAIMDDVRPLTDAAGRSAPAIESAAGRTDLLLRDLRVLSESLASTAHELPHMVRSTRELVEHTDELILALQRHWLISGFVERRKPERGFGLRRTTRPNPYDE